MHARPIYPGLDTNRRSSCTSVMVQRRAVERVTCANGWEMRWLADQGVSGAVPPESRERFKAALALLKADESGALIFTKWTEPAGTPRTSPA